MEKSKIKVSYNSPVILSFALISFAALVIDIITGGYMTKMFSVRFTSWIDPMMYARLLTHVFLHSGFAHYTGNFMMILVIGPMMEEKYGSYSMPFMIAATALVTGLLNILFFRDTALIGASGVVFMLILLASFANLKEGKIPLTVILVAVIYIGNEIVNGLFIQDNISSLSHIAGGFCGGFFGYLFNKRKLRGRR